MCSVCIFFFDTFLFTYKKIREPYRKVTWVITLTNHNMCFWSNMLESLSVAETETLVYYWLIAKTFVTDLMKCTTIITDWLWRVHFHYLPLSVYVSVLVSVLVKKLNYTNMSLFLLFFCWITNFGSLAYGFTIVNKYIYYPILFVWKLSNIKPSCYMACSNNMITTCLTSHIQLSLFHKCNRQTARFQQC